MEVLTLEQMPKGYQVGEEFDLGGFYAVLRKANEEEIGEDNEKDEDKYAYVAGIFSADTKDLQGEILDQDGVAEGLKDYFVQLNSQVDWEHEYARTKNPSELIGECVRFEPRTLKKKGKNGAKYRAHWGLFKLYKKKKRAQEVLEHLDAGGKLGASIHGVKLVPTEKDGRIRKVAITRISLTPNPVNTETTITNYDKFMKSLTAAGGAAMTQEDLEGDGKTTQYEDGKGKKKKVLARAKKMAGNLRKEGFSEKETRKAIVEHFGKHVTKGEFTMKDLAQATEEMEAALAKSVEEESSDKAAEGQTLIQKGLGMMGWATDAKGNLVRKASAEEDDEKANQIYTKAVEYLKGMERKSLLKMAYQMNGGKDVKGKNNDAIVGYMTKKLGKAGVCKMVGEHQKAAKSIEAATVDAELAVADDAILKSFEAEFDESPDPLLAKSAGEDGNSAGVVLGDVLSYVDLTKSILGLAKAVREPAENTLEKPVALLMSALAKSVEMQKDTYALLKALIQGVQAPSFNRTAMVDTSRVPTTVAKSFGAPAATGPMGEVHDYATTYPMLVKSAEAGKLTRNQVTVARNHLRKGEPLPDDVETILFPPQ